MAITIYNESCLDTIKRLADKSIDCVVTSPPYGGKAHNGWWTKGTKGEKAVNNVYAKGRLDDMLNTIVVMKPSKKRSEQ